LFIIDLTNKQKEPVMGGNAIKHVARLNKEDYENAVEYLIPNLMNILGKRTIKVVKAYNNKDSFGDIDILVESDNLCQKWMSTLKFWYELNDGDFKKNGNVFSFRYKKFNVQVDLILTPKDKLDIAWHYFNYNDLSNLLGRMTKKLGFKLGHNGLFYIERVGDHIISDICFSTDYFKALEYLELDIERYNKGFDELEDMFEFVASSPYFNPDIYLLHNRNHISRTHDKKRKTYNLFLQWCKENNEKLTHFQYNNENDFNGYGSTNNTRIEFTKKLLDDNRLVHYEVLNNRANYILKREFKKYFNGNTVAEYYGLEGKEIGKAMSLLKYRNTEDVMVDTISARTYKFPKLTLKN